MVLVVMAAMWATCSIPISLVLARVMAGPPSDLYRIDGPGPFARLPDGTLERLALLHPVRKH